MTQLTATGPRFLNLELIPTEHVGTDPAQAEGLANRKVPPALDFGHIFDRALGDMVSKTAVKWYDTQHLRCLRISENR